MAGPGQHYPLTSQVSTPMAMMNSPAGGVSSSGYGQSAATSGTPSQGFPAQSSASQQMMSRTKTVNPVSLCKLGQETNQELVNKLLEVFRQFKTVQIPNGTNSPLYQEQRLKMKETKEQLMVTFRKLHVIYNEVSELIVDPDENPEEVLVPLKGDPIEEKNTGTDAYKYSSEEHKQIVEQLQQKNRQIKEVIDKIRTIMWEINTMIVMRKT